jgi:hypothetical protein
MLIASCSSFGHFGNLPTFFVQYVPRKITHIDEENDALLNTMSLQLNHNAHSMTPIPTRNNCLSFGFIPYTQPPNKCLMLLGGGNPKTKCITLPINLARTYSKRDVVWIHDYYKSYTSRFHANFS